jgi:hypothetical protein
MIRRTVKAWLGLAVILLAAVPAWAEQWPDHEFFFVRSKMTHEGLKICELDLTLQVKQQLFALVFSQNESSAAPLIVNYMSADPHIALAERVTVAIDGAEILTFRPARRSSEPEITALAGPVSGEDAERAWATMRRVAEKATWLTVEAGDVTAEVPAKGLTETLADFAECRRQRSL